MTILENIIAEKHKEVERLKSGNVFEEAVPRREVDVPSFYETARKSKTMSIIAEIKRASPSKGTINAAVDPIAQAKTYADNGAAAISVLTDKPFFNGSMEDLRQVREVVDVPLLCKDFIIDEVQIEQAKRAGANIILLIAAALDDETMKRLYEYALKRELEVLLEVHNEEEMKRALGLGAKLIGINNRDLKTFNVDLETTARLSRLIDEDDIVLVSESGLKTPQDVVTVRDAGARAILVGETFMRADDVGGAIRSFQVPLR